MDFMQEKIVQGIKEEENWKRIDKIIYGLSQWLLPISQRHHAVFR